MILVPSQKGHHVSNFTCGAGGVKGLVAINLSWHKAGLACRSLEFGAQGYSPP